MIVDDLAREWERNVFPAAHHVKSACDTLGVLAGSLSSVIAFVTAPLPSQREADEVAIINSTTTVIFSL